MRISKFVSENERLTEEEKYADKVFGKTDTLQNQKEDKIDPIKLKMDQIYAKADTARAAVFVR